MKSLCIALALCCACQSFVLEGRSEGAAYICTDGTVLVADYNGGLVGTIREKSGAVIKEIKLDGTGKRAWKRAGTFSAKWEEMDYAAARAALGLPPAQ